MISVVVPAKAGTHTPRRPLRTGQAIQRRTRTACGYRSRPPARNCAL